MSWFERSSSELSAPALFNLYRGHLFDGELSWVAVDVILILTAHAILMFFLVLLFKRIILTTSFGRGLIGGSIVYLLAILLVLQSHFLDIILLSISLDSFKVFQNPLDAFYFVVGLYTTVGSNYSPPPEWQGLSMIIPFCGLFAFSLSGSALFTMLGFFLTARKLPSKEDQSY